MSEREAVLFWVCVLPAKDDEPVSRGCTRAGMLDDGCCACTPGGRGEMDTVEAIQYSAEL